ncbi:hypothetical protein KJ567_07070 [Candidatus Bipolaricaulota bacterium]|nr:hypothetical protein [Candidatus Bipolaricaulota bacterium]
MSEEDALSGFAFSMGEDGILRLRLARGTVIDLDLVKRIEARGRELFGEKPCPVLVYGDDARSIDRTARRYLAKTVGPTAQALVVRSPIGRVVASVFIGLGRETPHPMRTFATEEEAVTWLKGYVT